MSRRFGDGNVQQPADGGLDPALLAMLAEAGGAERDPLRRTAGRAAVIAAAASAREATRNGSWGRRWRRRVVAGALAVTGANLALGGVVALASGAQPDSILYGVKRATEDVKLGLTFDSVDHARLELQLADRRAAEAATMAASGHAGLALEAARDATDLVRDAGATLAGHPSPENEQALAHASAEALSRLQQVFAALESGGDRGASAAARSLDSAWSHGLGLGIRGEQGAGRQGESQGQGNAAGGSAGGAGGGPNGQGGPPATPPGQGGTHGNSGSGGHGPHTPPPGH